MRLLKLYNRKGFLIGLLWTAAGLFCLCRDIADPADLPAQQVKSVLLALLCLAIGLTRLARAFSKAATRADRIEEMDERNRLVKLRTDALTLRVLGYLQLAGTLIGILGFAFTENIVFGCLFLFAGLSVTTTAVIAVMAAFWYEKHL